MPRLMVTEVKSPYPAKQVSARSAKTRAKKSLKESGSDTEENVETDAYTSEEDADDDDVKSLDSDNLDEDSDFGKKRKRGGGSKTTPRKSAKPSPTRSKTGSAKKRREEDEEEYDVEKGQTVVGRVVEAPTTGQVPPGQISHNTLKFLAELKNPEHNDREWFRLHEPVYRQAEKEWVAFVGALMDRLSELDDQIPPLPPKDAIHRIYRDVRFSNDKTPYKTNFSASFSRGGRKGIFAHYHVSVSSDGDSLVAAGSWCPGKNEVATIRSHILRNAQPLRDVLENKDFVKLFGEAKKHPKGKRQNVFGQDDELKVAPKGIDKNHKDIDLLKLRSVAVVHRLPDDVVTSSKFMDKICEIMTVMRPLVHLLNEMISIPPESDEEEADE